MPALARQLRWYIAIRLVAIGSVLLLFFLLQLADTRQPTELSELGAPTTATTHGPAESSTTPQLAAQGETASPYGFLYVIAALTFAATLIYLSLLRLLPGHYQLQAYLQFFGDLLLITALVYQVGGISSPFSMLYLIVIAVAATLLRRRAGVAVATAAYVLYASLLLAIHFHAIPRPLFAGDEASIWRLTYNLAVHLFGFYAVALLTSYLAHNIARAELELEAKKEDLADLQVVHRDVIESISSGLVTADLEGIIKSVNRAGTEILRKGEADLVGAPIWFSGLFSAERWSELASASGQSGKVRSEVELTYGGTAGYVGFSISHLADADGVQRGYILIFQDLTRWRRLQEEMRVKDRMAAVGELAAGLAHEIGNPLAAISGSVQMLSANLPGESSQRRLLEILLKESQRLDRTIKGFLRFAKPRELSASEFDIGRLLTENFELLKNSGEVSERHRLSLDLEPTSAFLIADADQVSQIFWNLARNALRAMPEGGDLRICGRSGGGAYRLRFADTGRGMSPEQRANLFHPFRSFFDGGTGIGMAIVYRIVEEHRGQVSVESRAGEGATISVELPLSPPGPTTAELAVVEANP